MDRRCGAAVGRVIVSLECCDEFTDDPSIDLQLVVREGFFRRCLEEPSSVHEVTLQLEYGIEYPRNVQQITLRR